MMSVERLLQEGPVSMKEAAKFVRDITGREKPSMSVISRWWTDGLKGKRLDAMKVGGKWVTTRSALVEFIDACSLVREFGETPGNEAAGKDSVKAAAQPKSQPTWQVQQRRREIDQAKARLKERGLMFIVV